MLYSGYSILPRSVFWSADLIGRSDNADVIPLHAVTITGHMDFKLALERLTADEGLAFLELLAHNLTIQVRVASSRSLPHGKISADQTRKSMYWINESLHNVVQLTRDLRIGRDDWLAEDILSWFELWLDYEHAGEYVSSAIEMSFRELSNV